MAAGPTTITSILIDEHKLIKTFLAVLSNMCQRIEEGGAVAPIHLDLAVTFIREFADTFHHAKEENLLFPALEQAQIPDEDDLVGSLLAEHTLGRGLAGAMEDSTARLTDGNPGAAAEFAESARAFVLLLLQHICKEDSVLFPLADRQLRNDDQNKLHQATEETQESLSAVAVWEKHQAIVKELNDEFGASTEITDFC